MNDESNRPLAARQSREIGRRTKALREDYATYRKVRQMAASPQSAHMFALAARVKGESYMRTVEQIATELVGQLPDYWKRG